MPPAQASTHLPVLREADDVAVLNDGLPAEPLLRHPGVREGTKHVGRCVGQPQTAQRENLAVQAASLAATAAADARPQLDTLKPVHTA